MGSGSKGPQLGPDGFIWVQVAKTNGFCWFSLGVGGDGNVSSGFDLWDFLD